MEDTNAMVQAEPLEVEMVESARPFTLTPRTLDEAIQFAQIIARSELAPKDYRNKPDNVLVAVQFGGEIGLSPMQALQGIAVVNGRPTVWGDAALALVMASGLCESIDELNPEEALQTGAGKCIVKRRGQPVPVTRSFTVEEAKKANLWEKDSPWRTYPGRMLQMRARAFALRDAFPDVLKGVGIREEVEDIPVETTPTIMIPRALAPTAATPDHQPSPEPASTTAAPVTLEPPSQSPAPVREPGDDPPECKCGEPAIFREGTNKNGKHWRGWFCPRAKDDPKTCGFVRWVA